MNKYVALAKQAVEEYVRDGKAIEVPKNLPDEFLCKAGVFVTIHRGDELRGCVGTYLATRDNIAEEIIGNAIAACSQDGRFFPVSGNELEELSYEVSMLDEPRLLEKLQNHDPDKNGIIARCADGRCGLLLPDLDGINSAQEQALVACQKGGIDPEKDDVQYYCFGTKKYV